MANTLKQPKGSLTGRLFLRERKAEKQTDGKAQHHRPQQEHIPVDWEGMLRTSDEELANELFGPCVTKPYVIMLYKHTQSASLPHKLPLTVNGCVLSLLECMQHCRPC